MHLLWSVGKGLVLLLLTPALSAAQSAAPGDIANTVREVQQYGFAIHILAMLLVGFGFLMVFANLGLGRILPCPHPATACCAGVIDDLRRHAARCQWPVCPA